MKGQIDLSLCVRKQWGKEKAFSPLQMVKRLYMIKVK